MASSCQGKLTPHWKRMECLDPVLWPSGLKGSDLKSNDVEVCGDSLPRGPTTPSGPCRHAPVSPPSTGGTGRVVGKLLLLKRGPVLLPVCSLQTNPLRCVSKQAHTPDTLRTLTAESFPSQPSVPHTAPKSTFPALSCFWRGIRSPWKDN